MCHPSFISRANTREQNVCHAPLISDYSSASKCLLASTRDVALEWYCTGRANTVFRDL